MIIQIYIKNNIKRILFTASIFLLIPNFLLSNPKDTDYSQLNYNIYQNRDIFTFNESIYVFCRITNEGDKPALLRPISVAHTTFRIILRDSQGVNLPVKVNWVLKGDKWNQGLDSRERDPYERYGKYILLEPGESFIKRVNIQDLYDLKPGFNYYMKGYFYPDFIHKPNVVKKSVNWLKFKTEKLALLSNDTSRALHGIEPDNGKGLSPDEIVFLHLKAEAEKNTKRFIKYLSLPDYIQIFDRFVKSYNDRGFIGKRQVLNQFKQFLTRKRYDYLVDFRIKKTEYLNYKKEKSIVYVNIERYGGARPYLFEYIYTLKTTNEQPGWLITHLRVTRRKKKL